MFKDFLKKSFREKASSLVTTLMVIVVLTIIVVAFMQSMAIERLTSRSYSNIAQAKIIAEGGLNVAMQQVQLALSTNQAYVVGQTNDSANFGPVLIIGQKNLTNVGQIIPLISGDVSSIAAYPNNSSNSVINYINARTNDSTTSSVNVNLRNNLIDSNSDSNTYRAPWVYVTNSSGQTNARYAFIVLDEWARVNPFYHGQGLSRSDSTNWFLGPGSLPMATGNTNLFTPNEVTALRNLGTNTYVNFSLAQALADRDAYDRRKLYLSTDRTPAWDVIPGDLPEGGKAKYNINDLATNSSYGATSEERANRIAGIISTNLPNFWKRDLGQTLSGDDPTGLTYLRRLAASVVDYIDADDIPTSVNSGEPAGKELAPYVVMILERNTWISESKSGSNWQVNVRTEFFIQLWNPYTLPVTGNVSLEVINRQPINLPYTGSPSVQTDFQPFASPAPVSVTLRANEFKAVNMGTNDQVFPGTTNQPSSSSANYPGWDTTSSSSASLHGHPQFRMKWNGVYLDGQRVDPMVEPVNAGLPRSQTGGNFGPINTPRLSFNVIPANTPNTVADPRATWITASDWTASSLANALWQGRWLSSVNLTTLWASRDYLRSYSANTGTAMSSTSADPTALASKYAAADATAAPIYIRPTNDFSGLRSVGELGNVFDPVQLNDTEGNVNGGTPANYYRPSGGRSLQIGQPDHELFKTNGYRAIELIDLFTVNRTNSTSTNYPVSYGKINVNTAPLPVLQALFYNISPKSDGSAQNSTIDQTGASNIATLLISNRPYSRLSDLYKITPALANATNFSSALGTNLASNAYRKDLVSDVFDRAKEESFAKMVELSTVQSRAFRVYVVGEAINPKNLKRSAQAAIEASLSISTNAQGILTPTITFLKWQN